VGSYKGKLPILLVNIGGGSVELVVMQEGKVVEKQNLDLGVMSVLQEFPSINENLTPDLALEVKDKVKKDIEKFKTSLEWSIYTGGELTYMKLAKYKLITNRLFKNANHPLMISMKNFSKRNLGIYFNSTLSDLKKLMKDNPEWMKGAKTCCLMAEAIFEKLEIKYIIPTDVNLIHGVVYTD
jgi:exopolyphosphatase/pppGpp-phosphohydrolase